MQTSALKDTLQSFAQPWSQRFELPVRKAVSLWVCSKAS